MMDVDLTTWGWRLWRGGGEEERKGKEGTREEEAVLVVVVEKAGKIFGLGLTLDE